MRLKPLSKARKLTPEGAAKKVIVEYLDFLKNLTGNFDFWIQTSVGIYDPKSGRFRSKGKHERLGVSDISGILKPTGRRLEIEIKAPKKNKTAWDLCRPDQKAHILNMRNAGGCAGAASTIEELKEFLRTIPELEGQI